MLDSPFQNEVDYDAFLDLDGSDSFSIEGEAPRSQILQERPVRYDTRPLKATFTDLLQLAHEGHSTTKAAPPVVVASEQPSPFQASSQYAADSADR